MDVSATQILHILLGRPNKLLMLFVVNFDIAAIHFDDERVLDG